MGVIHVILSWGVTVVVSKPKLHVTMRFRAFTSQIETLIILTSVRFGYEMSI